MSSRFLGGAAHRVTWFTIAATLLACSAPSRPDGSVDGGTLFDAREATDTPSIDAGPTCAPPRTLCGSECVDRQTDRTHCGTCGTTCPAGSLCVVGRCEVSCPSGQVACGGQCVSLQTDLANCGACGTACPAGQVCTAGACGTTCATSLLACGTAGARYCADGQTDRANCGACGNACGAGNICQAGACEVSCGGSQVACGGVCRDTQTDRAHCGACGTACAAGQVCSAGTCRLSCQAGLTTCGTTCRDTQTDFAHCGACGTSCAPGQVCSAGACQLSCQSGLTQCSGTCRDLQSNNLHCGACGVACPAGQVCSSGACRTSCGTGLTDCAGTCRDTRTDLANCGACGTSCVAGQVCSAGTCQVSCGSGLTDCSGACRDTQTDRLNCNACGAACAPGQVCSAGTCQVSCAASLTDCSGVCRDTQTDLANCGACGVTCMAGQVCSGGACALTCQSGLTSCGGVCRDLQTNANFCGACSTACAPGQLCTAGVCACPAGRVLCNGACVDVLSDPANCGACSTSGAPRICVATNGTPSCANGTCAITCAPGFGDCDGTASNGCETATTATDVNHCGGCGIRCAFANASATCAAGACARGACAAGFADCDGVAANGCEVDTMSDRAHCGACGTAGDRACASGTVCSSGVCRASCSATQTDCGGSCVNTTTNPAHCGACGAACDSTGGVAFCAPDAVGTGVCGIRCDATHGDCDSNAANGCEADLTTTANCGRCANVCGAANGTASCTSGACAIACAGDYRDCDGNPANGCEVDRLTNYNHCGACGAACAAGQVCTAGACALTCSGGTTLCGSGATASCVDTRYDPTHCGSCTTACTTGQACVDGTCLAIATSVSFVGPAPDTAAPFGVTVSFSCRTDSPITLTGDFVGSPLVIGCDLSAATAHLPFTAGDGPKNITATQDAIPVSRRFQRLASAPIATFAAVPNTSNACGINQIVTHPRNRRNVLFMSNGTTHLQYSVDGGATVTLPVGNPFASGTITAWADPFTAGVFFVVFSGGPSLGEIYRSTDGGANWIRTGHTPALAGGVQIVSTNYAIWYDAFRMDFDARHRIYFGYPHGMARSDDDGATWATSIYPSLTSNYMTHVSVTPDRSAIFIGTDNLGVFRSSDNGLTLVPAPGLASLAPPYTTCGGWTLQQSGVLICPFNPLHMVAAAGWSDRKVMRSSDGGATWTNIGTAMGAVGATGIAYLSSSLAFEPGDMRTLWSQNYIRDCSGQGMVSTNDGGLTFRNVPSTMNIYSTVVGRAVDSSGNEILFRSNNCGQVDRERIDRF